MTVATKPHDNALSELLDRIRVARFRAGVFCPRCHDDRVHRWGSFSGRQRYRCLACRRTFSDLTGTPAAYVKKLHFWETHAGLLEQGWTLRRVAALLGIHLSTAFDWRHRLLDELRARDRATLTGEIEISDRWFAYSAKGRRRLGRRARKRTVASRTLYRGPTVRVLLACDRTGATVTALVEGSRVRACDLCDILAERVQGQPAVFARTGPLSPAGLFAKRMRGTFCWAHGLAGRALLSTVSAYAGRLNGWLERFCGVATDYLPNYLAWHRSADHRSGNLLRETLLCWPVTP